MNTFLTVIFGQSINFLWIVSALLALWEFLGRIFPTLAKTPPTPVGWIVSLLNWINQTFNNTKK